jgi:hypothetical protein
VPLDTFDVPEELQTIWKSQCGSLDGGDMVKRLRLRVKA